MAGWYYKHADGPVGPLTSKELKSHADAGTVTPDTDIRAPDGRWVKATSVRGLFDVSSKGANPVAPPVPQSDDTFWEAVESSDEPNQNPYQAPTSTPPVPLPRRRGEFLSLESRGFKVFVTPSLVVAAWWIAVILLLIVNPLLQTTVLSGGQFSIDPELAPPPGGGFIVHIIIGALMLVPIRLALESVMVFFRICKLLEEIRDK